MDELKKYIQANKELLDADLPDPRIWENIQEQLNPAPKTIKVVQLVKWAVAACIIGLLGIGGWYFVQAPSSIKINNQIANTATEHKKTITAPTAIPQKESLAVLSKKENKPINTNTIEQTALKNSTVDITNEPAIASLEVLKNLETSFVQVINLQKARINTMPMYAESAGYFKDFSVQLKDMDHEEKLIQVAIAKSGITNELLDQLINIYQQKLLVLKQLQLEMNKTNNRFKQNRGPVDTTRNYFINI